MNPNPNNTLQQSRTPIVAVLGHVDHGKTTLLDALRKTAVWDTEEGGITQHISWSLLNHKGKDITFIDTPGHQAFSIMREVGGKIADIVLLIIAADDGIQPQTKEAIQILKEANSEIIVVITKMDLPNANPEKIKQQLAEEQIFVEGWGGQTPIIEVSAKTGKGLEELLDMIILVAEMKELKANQHPYGLGVILDSWVDKSLGKCIDVIVIKGNFNKRSFILCNNITDKCGVILDRNSKQVDIVNEGYGVRLIGLGKLHQAGSIIYCSCNEKSLNEAPKYFTGFAYGGCNLTCDFNNKPKEIESLEDLFTEDNRKVINIVIKADTQGVLDAILKELKKIQEEFDKIKFDVIWSGIGPIVVDDIEKAHAGKCKEVLGFNVGVDHIAMKKSRETSTDIKMYTIIYKLIEDIKAIAEKASKTDIEEEIVGIAKIKQIFTLSEGTPVAGSTVVEGKINKGYKVKLFRNNNLIAETKIDSLRIFKEKVSVVSQGSECGITFADSIEFQEGDEIKCIKIL